MNLNIHENRKKILGLIFLVLIVLFVVSMTANIITGLLAWHFASTQRTVTVPMYFNQPFTSDAKSGDSNLMSMLATSFAYLRLTVSPETIDNQQKILLQYVPAASRDSLKKALDVEADYIKRYGVSSKYQISEIRELAPGELLMTGELAASTTNGQLSLSNSGTATPNDRRSNASNGPTVINNQFPLKPDKKTYHLKIQYTNGLVSLLDFSEIIIPSKQK